MINAKALKEEIRKKGYTQATFCGQIGMSQSTFSRRMKKRVFTTEEMEKITKALKLKNPMSFFLFQN